MRRIHLGVGEFHCEARPAVLSTVLGSCVSVCFFDLERHIGGMNHIFLPGSADMKDFNVSTRYSVNAMELLINRMLSIGAGRGRLQAKVFGGGHMLADTPQVFSPGKDNARFVFYFLETEGIGVLSYNVGGDCGRKIDFYTHSGQVFMKRIIPHSSRGIGRRELRFGEKFEKEFSKSGETVLFR